MLRVGGNGVRMMLRNGYKSLRGGKMVEEMVKQDQGGGGEDGEGGE